MLELVQSWTARAESPREIVLAALEFFRTQGFVYSLSPGAYTGPDALDDLLFRRKIGFCEHYAGTFATLMRLAGIPARVVVGYQGGQYNQYGNYLLVRQSDAHAWCEVWLPEGGWTRIDPTTVIAPARLNLGSLRDMGTTSVQRETDAGMPLVHSEGASLGLLGNARMAWDTVSYAWDARVLSFDVDGQREFLVQLGLEMIPAKALLLWLIAAAATLLALYAALILWRSRAEPDAVKQLYDSFCRKAAQLGAERSASEGPIDFARRAAALLPQQAPLIGRIARSYVALRYSPERGASVARDFAADVRAFTRGSTAR
jgi:hypothetical protein